MPVEHFTNSAGEVTGAKDVPSLYGWDGADVLPHLPEVKKWLEKGVNIYAVFEGPEQFAKAQDYVRSPIGKGGIYLEINHNSIDSDGAQSQQSWAVVCFDSIHRLKVMQETLGLGSMMVYYLLEDASCHGILLAPKLREKQELGRN